MSEHVESSESASVSRPLPAHYMGDNVFARYDGWNVVVWATDGEHHGLPLYFSPMTMGNLFNFASVAFQPPKREETN